MKIDPATLDRQFERARISWPFIDDVERRYNLPSRLLYAVGSRETNLTDEIGDGGHGRSVWQLDDRSHTIPDPFPVEMAADIAGQMLRGLLDHFSGHREPAVAAYNAGVGGVERALSRGQSPDAATTGGDYSADVLARMEYLQTRFPDTQPEEGDMPQPSDKVRALKNPNGAGFYELQADGGIITRDGATFPQGMPAYWVLRTDGSIYHFPYTPPGGAEPVMNYVGLPDDAKKGIGWISDFGWD